MVIDSLEDRMEHFAKKRKLTTASDDTTVASPAGEWKKVVRVASLSGEKHLPPLVENGKEGNKSSFPWIRMENQRVRSGIVVLGNLRGIGRTLQLGGDKVWATKLWQNISSWGQCLTFDN